MSRNAMSREIILANLRRADERLESVMAEICHRADQPDRREKEEARDDLALVVSDVLDVIYELGKSNK